MALYQSLIRFYQSDGRDIDSEDDILYTKRAIMLRLRRLYDKISKIKSQQRSGNISIAASKKLTIVQPYLEKWRRAMTDSIRTKTGAQKRRQRQ